MAILRVFRGLPGSGKTTAARALVDAAPLGSVVRLNRDALREMMLPTGYRRMVDAAETVVTVAQLAPLADLLARGVDVIIDDTNLRAVVVRRFAAVAARAGAEFVLDDQCLDVTVDECVRRDALRADPVGEARIRDMHQRFLHRGHLPPIVGVPAPAGTGRGPYTPAVGAPDAIMVDIDGTVALHNGRGPFDTSRYHEDLPNDPVVQLVCMAWESGHRIVFCSGRDATHREVTAAWLDQHVLPQAAGWELHMRAAGDRRPDDVVKVELFDQHVRDRYAVRFVLDDRDRVVMAWRRLGLTVLQVAEGNF